MLTEKKREFIVSYIMRYSDELGDYFYDLANDDLEHHLEGLDDKQLISIYKMIKDEMSINEDKDPCWKNYKQLGTKEKNGKTVPNCVPVNEDYDTRPAINKDYIEIEAPVGSKDAKYFDAIKGNNIFKRSKFGTRNYESIGRRNFYNFHLSEKDLLLSRLNKLYNKTNDENIYSWIESIESYDPNIKECDDMKLSEVRKIVNKLIKESKENQINYKGKNITKKFPSGMYEFYSDKQKKFLKFDDLGAAKKAVDNDMKK